MKLRSVRMERPPVRKTVGQAPSPPDLYYKSWNPLFRGTSKDGSTKAGISTAKGFGVFFKVNF